MLTKVEISAFLAREFPQTKCVFESLGDGEAVLSHPVGQDEIRPGGTVSGPVLMELADVALYVALFTRIGIVPLAVTTNLTTNFLRKPPHGDVLVECRLLKLRARLGLRPCQRSAALAKDRRAPCRRRRRFKRDRIVERRLPDLALNFGQQQLVRVDGPARCAALGR